MEKRSKSISLVCFGFGLTAKYFVKELLKNKYRINLITTSRSKTVNKKFLNIKYKNFYFDNNKFDKKIIKHISRSVFFCNRWDLYHIGPVFF
jgi:hypothetical protein